jgi:spoIIIJ-associated protein
MSERVDGRELSVEATGETVGEAKWSALRELERKRPGLDKASVRFQVVSEGERGLLGVGYEPARVVASVEDVTPAPAPPAPAREPGESEASALMRELVGRIAREIGAQCTVEVEETDEEIYVTCSGRDLGMLIGRHGQTIDAIQYLANAVLYRARDEREERKHVTVDAAGYRARRQATLDALALRSAERATATRQRVELEPMTAVERKIVHERLKDDPEVETVSEGTEPNRYVVIVPRSFAL